jgi:hypothetical protein
MWGDLFSEVFLKFVAPVMTTLAMALVSLVLAKVRQKLHFQLFKSIDERLEKDVGVAVLAQENKAADWMKNAGNRKITGAEKFANVLNNMVSAYPAADPERIKNLIHATVLATPGIGSKDLIARSNDGDAGKFGGQVAEGLQPSTGAGRVDVGAGQSKEAGSAGQILAGADGKSDPGANKRADMEMVERDQRGR